MNCPECQVEVPMCSCGVWECGLHGHYGSDCPTPSSIAYRRKIKINKIRNAIMNHSKLIEALPDTPIEELRSLLIELFDIVPEEEHRVDAYLAKGG